VLSYVLFVVLSGTPWEVQDLLETHAPALLSDSRLPRRNDVAPCWRERPDKLPFSFSADLDGDGSLDWAVMLLRVPSGSFQLVVLLGRQDDTYRPIVLEKSPYYAKDYCIVEAPAGQYETARGKGYELGNVHDHDPPEVTLVNAGIHLARFETAGWLWFWDAEAKQFRKVQTSD
jgi:hypothetical protein